MKTPQPLVVDTERRVVTKGGREIYLAPKQFDIIVVLAQAEGKVVSREKLLDRVWGSGVGAMELDSRAVDQQIVRARKQIGEGYILTAPTAGYRIVNATINNLSETWGSVTEVQRFFGKKPGAIVTVAVSGSALDRVSEGHRVRVI